MISALLSAGAGCFDAGRVGCTAEVPAGNAPALARELERIARDAYAESPSLFERENRLVEGMRARRAKEEMEDLTLAQAGAEIGAVELPSFALH